MSAAERQRRVRTRRKTHSETDRAETIAYSDALDDLLGTLGGFLENMASDTPDQSNRLSELRAIVEESKQVRQFIKRTFEERRKEIEEQLLKR